MGPFIITLAVLAVVGVAVWLYRSTKRSDRELAAVRQRYMLPTDGPAVPLARPAPEATVGAEEDDGVVVFRADPLVEPEFSPPAPRTELDPLEINDELVADEGPVLGRMVSTPDGDMILTTPPFALRESLVNNREARYVASIRKRLPDGYAVCPKVRLESLVTPTPPDGRDPADWRVWRRRVRMRVVDLVICDTRSGLWRPVVAIEVDRPVTSARVPGGGADRLIDEVLTHVGLPLVRCKGDPRSDWPMIEPYVAEASTARG